MSKIGSKLQKVIVQAFAFMKIFARIFLLALQTGRVLSTSKKLIYIFLFHIWHAFKALKHHLEQLSQQLDLIYKNAQESQTVDLPVKADEGALQQPADEEQVQEKPVKSVSMLDRPSLQKTCQGLHSLLPDTDQYHYSILIPVYHPKPQFLACAVQSACNQSAPHCEVLLGLDGPQPAETIETIEQLIKSNEHNSVRIRVIQVDRAATGGGISATTNALAAAAKGNYLLLMDHDDWISPDLLFRYEQTLRLLEDPANSVLYCNEFKINEDDLEIPGSHFTKPEHPSFPYLFINLICHCLLVPKNLWLKTGGLRSKCDGAQDFDLSLRLEQHGAIFQNVPFFLYAWRAHADSTAQNIDQKDYATPAGILALSEYAAAKGLDWEITEGAMKTQYRAKPRLKSQQRVHVIIPFRDQQELTLLSLKHLLAQKNVELAVSLINNRSQDLELLRTLAELPVEVLEVDEPFNFSRLCNLGVQRSQFATSFENVLFLNNDVLLEPDALEEMTRWLEQPKIGMIGAKLLYPNGNLQHGGITMNGNSAIRMQWCHIDGNQPPEHWAWSKFLQVCDAVTGACALLKKENFWRVGGFDEIWYPISYSDTHLACKLRELGLYSLYTPYAQGIHRGSVSRGFEKYEDFESSYWLHRQTSRRFQEIQPLTQQRPRQQAQHSLFLTGY